MEDQMPSGNKKIVMIVGAAVLVLGVLMLVLVAASKKTQPQTGGDQSTVKDTVGGGSTAPAVKTTPLPTTITKKDNDQGKPNSNLDVSKIVLAWLDKQRDPKGVYYGQILCSQTGVCAGSATTFQSGAASIWGRFKYYQQVHNPADLEIINKDINLYADRNKVTSLQNYFYNCKLMYELFKSTAIDAERRESIKKICLDSQPFPPIENSDSIKINVIDVMQKKQIPLNVTVQKEQVRYYAVAVSDMVARTEWEKQDYFPDAKDYFNQALIAFAKLNYSYDAHTPLLGVAALDLYKATNDKLYLTFANFIYNTYGKQKCSSPMQCANMIYFLRQLNAVAAKPQYITDINQAKQQMINIGFDYPGYPAVKSGTGEFFTDSEANHTVINVSDNGFIAGLLTE
jgi:hypothetical protein